MGASVAGVSHHDPFRNQWLSAVVCSPPCAAAYHKNAEADFAHWQRLRTAEEKRQKEIKDTGMASVLAASHSS